MTTTSLAKCGLPPHADDPRCSCKGKDPDLWFPKQGYPWVASIAKKICWTCPLKVECLEWAIPVTDLVGIFGGTTAADRKRLRNERAGG